MKFRECAYVSDFFQTPRCVVYNTYIRVLAKFVQLVEEQLNLDLNCLFWPLKCNSDTDYDFISAVSSYPNTQYPWTEKSIFSRNVCTYSWLLPHAHML